MIATNSSDQTQHAHQPSAEIEVALSTEWDEAQSSIFWMPDEAFCVRCLQTGLALLHQDAPYAISIHLCSAAESANLNRLYRGKDKATNVLSFPAKHQETEEALWQPPHHAEQQELLGDLVLCPEVVNREAEEQGKTLADHWTHMLLHGLFHLLGHDHIEPSDAEEMEALEIDALQKLGINNPYLID